jgi:hypothetical protein
MVDSTPATTPFDIKMEYTIRYARFIRAELAALENRYDRVLRREKRSGSDQRMYDALLRERGMYIRLYESALKEVDTTLSTMQQVNAEWADKCPMVVCNAGIRSQEDFQAARPYMTTGTDTERCGALHVHWPSLTCPDTPVVDPPKSSVQ